MAWNELRERRDRHGASSQQVRQPKPSRTNAKPYLTLMNQRPVDNYEVSKATDSGGVPAASTSTQLDVGTTGQRRPRVSGSSPVDARQARGVERGPRPGPFPPVRRGQTERKTTEGSSEAEDNGKPSRQAQREAKSRAHEPTLGRQLRGQRSTR